MNEPILVTGATGFVGKAITDCFRAAGKTVIAVGRAETGELGPETPWRPMLCGIDTIVHCAGRAHVLREEERDPLNAYVKANRDATISLAEAAATSGVRRLIFLSSIGVNGGETISKPFDRDDNPNPHTPYAHSKYEAELALRAIEKRTGLEVVIIRPPLILGKDPKGNLGTLVAAMRRGIPLPFGAIQNNRRDLVSLKTLCSLVQTCVTHPKAAGETFLVSDGRPYSTYDIAKGLAQLNGLPPRFIPIPQKLLEYGLVLLGKKQMANQLLGNLEVTIDSTCQILNWQPPMSNLC